jgi:hypothetical protein
MTFEVAPREWVAETGVVAVESAVATGKLLATTGADLVAALAERAWGTRARSALGG